MSMSADILTRPAPAGATRIPYGSEPQQFGDLRLPAGRGPHPLAVVIHGGFWRAGFTKTNTEAAAVALAEAGWATWNIEYRRVGSGGGYQQTLADVSVACRAISPLVEPLNPRGVLAVGHSAGGQLALWAAAEGLVAAAVALAGVCDLTAAARDGLGEGAVANFMGGEPEVMDARYANADPIRRLPLAVPTLLVHGTRDERVPIAYSRRFAAAAERAGDHCRLLELDGADHFDIIDPRSSQWSTIVARISQLLS